MQYGCTELCCTAVVAPVVMLARLGACSRAGVAVMLGLSCLVSPAHAAGRGGRWRWQAAAGVEAGWGVGCKQQR